MKLDVKAKGYNKDFFAILAELGMIEKDGGTDFDAVAAANSDGFDPDDVWRAHCRVTRMVMSDHELDRAEDLIRLAKALRRHWGRK